MFRKHIYIFLTAFLIVAQASAQFRPEGISSGNSSFGNLGQSTGSRNSSDQDSLKSGAKKKLKIPSVIRVWKLKDQGSRISPSELDTALTFYQIYQPFEQLSISNDFTGNIGGAYQTNDFFKRTYNSDFYFARSFDAYWLTPSQVNYFNTTTPYSLLDYTQSENSNVKNETRFNVTHSQNINKKLNFEFIYNQDKSQGQYPFQVTKFHNIVIGTSYNSDKFLSHANIIFNRLQAQENGGIASDQPLNESGKKTEEFVTRMNDAENKIQNTTFYMSNEYRVGKKIEADSVDNKVDKFIPRVGFIHELEYSSNRRRFTYGLQDTAFFQNTYVDSITVDSVRYARLTNIFQIKFYEAPDRKYTFGKRVYIGSDQLWYKFSTPGKYYPQKQSNSFIGGGIFRTEGKFWQWAADGRIYLTGYRVGQTELNGYINKPLRIGRDTTSLRIEGSLKTLVPDYFDEYFYSNHFEWTNRFNNINELTLKASVHSQEYKTTLGANYSLIGNYIYNNEQALPTQAGSELMVISAYLNKDFESRHWLVRTQVLAQKASNTKYVHLPDFAGFISLNYRTLWSKVMYTQIGIDTHYNTLFYADAYQPGTTSFYLQNTQKIGNYPYIDFHVNLKLKRTRFFFKLMNVGSGFVGDNYFSAPDYPYYRRTYRIGVAWSFYD